MNKGYSKEDEKRFAQMMQLICGRYHPEKANLHDFITKAVPKLPKKMQKQIKSFWGIGGGINHHEKINNLIKKRKNIPEAEKDMNDNAMLVLNMLGTLDYLVLFHEGVREMVKQVAKKTSGEENELEAAKWADLYATMIINGPHMNYDDVDSVLTAKESQTESLMMLDKARILQMEYNSIFYNFKDGELSIPTVKHWLEDLDVKDRVTLHNFFGIEMPKYLKEFEGEEIVTFMQLRQLKEKIFSNGPWVTDGYMFIERGIQSENTVKCFCRIFELIKEGVKIERAEPQDFTFGTGKKQISWYRIHDGEEIIFEFPYIEEIMFLRFVDKYAQKFAGWLLYQLGTDIFETSFLCHSDSDAFQARQC